MLLVRMQKTLSFWDQEGWDRNMTEAWVAWLKVFFSQSYLDLFMFMQNQSIP